MSDEETKEGQNEAVLAMGKDVKPDVPVGLMTIPKGASAHAIARRTTGDLIKNEMEFHCMACGWNKTLHFDEDEMAALDNKIGEYTGPCPGCQCMTLVPKDAFWGKDFPSMSASAMKQKRDEARVGAEELANVVEERIVKLASGGMGIPSPATPPAEPAPAPDRSDLPDAPDPSKLKPR